MSHKYPATNLLYEQALCCRWLGEGIEMCGQGAWEDECDEFAVLEDLLAV